MVGIKRKGWEEKGEVGGTTVPAACYAVLLVTTSVFHGGGKGCTTARTSKNFLFLAPSP